MIEVINEYQVEEVIIVIEILEYNCFCEILNVFFDFDCSLLVKIILDMYDIMFGMVKMNYVFGVVLIEISWELMFCW